MTAMPMQMPMPMPMMNGPMGGMPMMMPMPMPMMGMNMMPMMNGMNPMMGQMPMGMPMAMPMMMRMPLVAKMTCEMTRDGMVCKIAPTDAAQMETLKDCCEAMTSMMAMGMPCTLTVNGMPMIACVTR